MRTILKACCALAPVVLAASCAVPGTHRTPAPVEERDPSPAAGATARALPDAETPVGGFEPLPPGDAASGEEAPAPAVVALLDESDRKLRAGEDESAAAAIERALRISPANPTLWYRLAVIRIGQGQWSQAEALAQKSLSLSSGDTRLEEDNWKLIARARRELGDDAGARAAEIAASRADSGAVD